MGLNIKLKLVLFMLLVIAVAGCQNVQQRGTDDDLKLYWFIPDGVRADPDTFKIYKWAENGELPNIKRLMDAGSYGYSIPNFPSHTPVNFATLLTGTNPDKHGVADGPMHVEGRPLDKVAIGGFSSVAKKIDPIWVTLEENGEEVLLLSVPGSTPPELDNGITIRGRWGGWGADFHAINFETKGDLSRRKEQGRGARLFFFGPQLTQYIDPREPENWTIEPVSYSEPMETELSAWGSTIYAYIYDSTDDDEVNYNRILFSKDKKTEISRLSEGEWSSWAPVELAWQDTKIESNVMMTVIKLDNDGFFRLRLFYDNMNIYNVQPSYVAGEFEEAVGPMTDFVDNFPPQLIYYNEDKKTFLQEMNMTFDWHTETIPFMIEQYHPDVIIHDIYSPNQMLTSRWWMGYIDPDSRRYTFADEGEREQLWTEVKDMYKKIDRMIGEILDNADENTIIVLSSDHGAVPLDKWVRLNNFFAEKSWLKFTIDEQTGEPIIDWENSTVVYLKMDNVYIDPEGLDGNWTRSSGEEYETLRQQVKAALIGLEDPETGERVVEGVVDWEDVEEYLDLPPDRVGDLVIANKAGYGWNEEMTGSGEIFSTPLKTGYKQAIFPDESKGMWTPFMIMGPGIKQGHMIESPINHRDQYPTIMQLLQIEPGTDVDGQVLTEIIE